MKKKLPTLTKGQRGHIYDTMTDDQIKVLSEFCMYELKSRFHTNRFLAETDWEFEGIQIDPWYNRSKEHQGMNYHCECGRRVKNLFILRSKDRHNGQYLIKRLGITHFEQEAGIPKIVTNEILNQMNEINIYRDQILLDYKEHQKFPNQLFKTAVGLGVFENHQYTTLYKKCESFQRAGLPLFINDKRRLKRAVKHSPKNTFWYKGKYQATFTDKISAEKCYVSLTKYLINYNPIISHVSLKKLNEIVGQALDNNDWVDAPIFKVAIFSKLFLPPYLYNEVYSSEKYELIKRDVEKAFPLNHYLQDTLPEKVYVDVLTNILKASLPNIKKRRKKVSVFQLYYSVIKNYLNRVNKYDGNDDKKIAILWITEFIEEHYSSTRRFERFGNIRHAFNNAFPTFRIMFLPNELKIELIKVKNIYNPSQQNNPTSKNKPNKKKAAQPMKSVKLHPIKDPVKLETKSATKQSTCINLANARSSKWEGSIFASYRK